MAPECASQPEPHPTNKADQHLGGFAEAEVAAPSHHIGGKSLHCRLDAYALGLSRDLPDFVFETHQSFRIIRSSDLWAVCKTKPEELSLLRSRHRALRLIYLEFESLSDEARNVHHHPLTHAFATQLAERRTEPNSGLGEAISYLLRHWQPLTLFLRKASAPLDNNIAERALKRAILHRKNALFYRTLHGAQVGDLFMSLIHTCQLCGANSFDYLVELQRHAQELAACPADWMPWNYRETLYPRTKTRPWGPRVWGGL